ncbi:MAG: AAA family ATPase [Reyranellaceae bacterium]
MTLEALDLERLDAEIEARGGAATVVQRVARRHQDPDESVVRRLDYVLADTLDDAEEQYDDELIEGTLGRAAMAVLYGDSNSGKTFAAIDMGASVARGVEWLGRPTDVGLVVYLATESPASVEMRLKAYQRHHKLRVPGFVIVRSPINLFDGQADTAAVISLVGELESEHGAKVALIIGDTLARLVVGANENSGEDMGVVVRNIDAIRASTGAAFLVIHHTGKDAAKGMRGWSGLRAATDTEIEVTVDEATGLRSAEITKQRDLPGKGDRIGFRLVPMRLGVNRWGTERGSCVVEASDAPEKRAKTKRRSEVAGAIEEFLRSHGAGCQKGGVVKHFEGQYVRTSVYRELAKMVDSGELIEAAGMVSLPGRPKSPK